MDKKTKLWLGAGIVGLGAYLLWKSKKAAPALTSSAAPANLVGFDTGKFYDVKGGHAGVEDQGIFTNADGFAEAAGGWNPFRRKKKSATVVVEDLGGDPYAPWHFAQAAGKPKRKGSVKAYPLDKGEFVTFANQPFNFSGNDIVGERKVAFADAVGDRQVSADGRESRFFKPETEKFRKPVRKSPVEPSKPTPMKQDKPVNNFASAEGAGMINSFKVKSGFDPLVNR